MDGSGAIAQHHAAVSHEYAAEEGSAATRGGTGAGDVSSTPVGAPAIHLLPSELVDKIAAGEVVERPASVVKELIENALDAGATAIRVEVQRGGFSLIRVSDDGHGIRPDALALAVCRHATSKLDSAEGLFRIRTLGFRGEALASIAAVSHLEITSCPHGQAAAQTIRVEGGTVVAQRRTGAPEGTVVTVRQLFYNVPARQAFQRTVAGEARQISQLCSQLALVTPHVRFTLDLDGRTVLHTPGTGQLLEALSAVYGVGVAGRMLALPELEEGGLRVWGFCSAPEEHRNTRLYLTFGVNGRLVKSGTLAYAVEEGYHTLLPTGRHPLAAVCLVAPPDEVDVNVHPTKLEIRLRRERLAFALVRNAVREALRDFAPIPNLHPEAIGGEPASPDPSIAPQVMPAFGAFPGSPTQAQLPEATSTSTLDPLLLGTPSGVAAPDHPIRSNSAPGPGAESEDHTPNTAAARSARSQTRQAGLRPLGQVGAMYIVAEDASGVYLIDQHSAHERVVYEQLLRHDGGAASAASAPSQLLLEPEAIELNSAQDAWLREYGDALAPYGFGLEPFGGRTWLLRAVPLAVAARGRIKALGELIDGLIEHEYGDGPVHDQARWAVACHSAVRAGDTLHSEEMTALIAQLEQCDMRRTCPHGRPTMIHLSHAQLQREFGRR